MKKILSLPLFISILLGSCSQSAEKENGKIRFMFEPGDLQFISSSFNPDQQTMSALYGNQQALSMLTAPDKKLTATDFKGTDLKLVTYRMQDDPNYFGSKVNGELLLVERLASDPKGKLAYGIEFGQSLPGQSKEQRMAQILDQEPVQFPQ